VESQIAAEGHREPQLQNAAADERKLTQMLHWREESSVQDDVPKMLCFVLREDKPIRHERSASFVFICGQWKFSAAIRGSN
jgi:hypothetical protein